MFRFVFVLLCISSIEALPSSKNDTKVFLSKFVGPRIINGKEASLGQFPHQVGLYLDADDGTWFCGGSLISEEWILTAGHCVDGVTSGVVVSGSPNINNGLVSPLSEAIMHEGFDGVSLKNDVGLVRLSAPLAFDDYTSAISLSSETLEAGVNVTVSGWGITSDDGTAISPNLNYVQLVTISNEECGQTFGSLGDDMVCANSGTNKIESTCSGDSGGGLVTGIGSNAQHVAIVSFVSDFGCETGAPSGYTRTAAHRDWIQEHTGI